MPIISSPAPFCGTTTSTWGNSLDDAGLTCDGFLGGRLRIWQPAKGYRAGVDPVFLAAAAPVRAGETVLELGCGVGTAALCLLTRVPMAQVTGLEVQLDYAALARRNADENRTALAVVEGDLTQMPTELRAQSFYHVIANPPYFDRTKGTAATDGGRDTALAGDTPLAAWIDAAVRRLKPGGRLTVIQRAERLGDLLKACDGRLGHLRLLPIAAREGRAAERILLHGRKGGKGALRLLAPVVLHDGARHERDGDDYSETARAVLRDGSGLPVDWS